MGEEIAKELGLTHIVDGELNCGFWDMGDIKMSDILKEQYGEMKTIMYHDNEQVNGRWKTCVEVGYRFSLPQLLVRGRLEDNREWLATVEFSPYVYEGEKLVDSGDYTYAGSQVWKKEGLEMLHALMDMWAERGGE